MTGALAPRLVLVTRETEYDGLLARHATRGQAVAFLRRRAEEAAGPADFQTLDQLEAQRAHVAALLAEIRAGAPKGWRIASVRRTELDRFLFAPEDVVVAVGQDGLVANLAKYLSGQPVIGVNAEPSRNAGVLVPHTAAAAAAMLPRAAAGTLPTEPRTMIQAQLDDGQTLLALNEIFVGHRSHQSARYSLHHAGRQEAQSSSGLIVASGTGATGWALSISRATGVTVDVAPNEPAAVFLVREPWPSRATGASLSYGRLQGDEALLVVSRMNEGGVVFADGIEADRLDFAWGRTLRVSVARQQLRFVPGSPPRPPAAARVDPLKRRGPVRVAPAVAAAPPPAAPPVQRRRRWRRGLLLLLLAALAIPLVRGCDTRAPPPRQLGPGEKAPLSDKLAL
ncbi:diacylglycerol kinase catalytic domain-containing protein [Roseomonas haemaphysalidis]|uniref:NAD(+)/NADH kinase n=1 Tax=Roseomonas haemaphysalidis TaxID=2768162 RepID=UPI001A96B323|nr:NAD(+)/NADH kinase [Roseomonas haemaphysalidis]